MDTVEGLQQELRKFFEDRDWRRFHAPKNIVMSLVSETAELMQHFRWMSEEASWKISSEILPEVRDEVGDVLINLIAFCDELGIDPIQAAREKLLKIEKRYPLLQGEETNPYPCKKK